MHAGRAFLVAVAAALALVVSACGSSGSAGTTTTSSVAPGEPSSGPGATAAITGAYKTLFNLANPAISPKVAVVQDGAALRGTLTREITSPLAKQATGAVVDSVEVHTGASCANESLSAPCAAVSYNILSAAHKPLFTAPAKGWAVYQAGNWLVAKATICGLLALASGNGGAPAGC